MEKEELTVLFLQYEPYFRYLAGLRLSNHADAEDAVQATFVRAWMYCSCVKEKASFYAWLIRILVNECNNILRKKRRSPEVYVGDDVLCTYACTDDTHIVRMDFLQAIKVLDDRYRLPIQMIFLYGYTSEETALRLHMTRSAVSGMVRRGKEKLRAAM